MISLTGIKLIKEFLLSKLQHISDLYVEEKHLYHVKKSLDDLPGIRGTNLNTLSSREMRNRFQDLDIKNGIVGVMESFQYYDMGGFSCGKDGTYLVVMLDRISDPHNLGAVSRSAYCFGATGIIIQSRRSCTVTSSAISASAGALAHIPVMRANNLARTLESFKEQGFWVYGTGSGYEVGVDDIDFDKKSLILFGSEGEGIREKLIDKCDFLLSIPLISSFDSLNVSVAAGVSIYIARKNMTKLYTN